VEAGAEIGADGLLGRLRLGKGTALFAQLDPDQFEADTATYFRITRWRQMRALSQVLANLGAEFSADKYTASLVRAPAGLYHADYRADFESGDDPYRYFRW
jgi:beta-galactosidase